MRILHVVRGLTNESGTTHVVIPMAEEQARQGARVSVLFVDKPPYASLRPAPALVDSQEFPQSLPLVHPGVSWSFAGAIKTRIHEFDVVHIHAVWNFPTWWTMRTALKARIPFMVAPHGSLEPWAYNHGSRRRRIYARYIERPLLAQAARLQASTNTEAGQFRAFGLDVPAAVIPNGVSPDWLEGKRGNLAAHLGLAAGTKTLLFLSRLHEKKGLDILLRAFAAALHSLSGLVLVVAGCDAGSGYDNKMRNLANVLGLRDRCLFIGEVREEKKREVLFGADAFALTSHSEGLPMAVLVAMASGLPVIITPGCNLPEVASWDAGLIVEPSVESAATGLREMFGEPSRMRERGENGRALVRHRFTWPRIVRDTLAVYGEMIRDGNRTVR
uniref:Glycosyltransferase involved in cell wall bisynthesis n=1 Tax=Candidatus Kentrum sp. FM TaxID=2126340 RepID=A0A450TKX2_9GAMM|nr:MAG: Glycosyltransferase involved in cell wall bisynthesis [Candidatus Kentron sp. FM]VFJ69145.1 MAG: Glycosyltransferase involved in cell wall bisynthesis [Candidatus Kentron sp. FM]VFK17463.1 MAG: Glycosyltransferase involved in cell wall bisynthesis [Candidatus Kentron sp. FM]